jgi:hypothetical protein
MIPDYPRLNFPAVKLRISQRGEQIIRFFILESYIGQHFYFLHVKVAFCF